jgi:hypothetical protein
MTEDRMAVLDMLRKATADGPASRSRRAGGGTAALANDA